MDPVALVAESSEQEDDDFSEVKHNCYFPDGTDHNPESGLPKISFLRTAVNTVRPDYILKHLDYKSFKIVLRTWVMIWVTTVLLTVPRTGIWLGNAAYISQVIGFIVTAGGKSVIMCWYTSITCSLAAVIGWLFGIISQVISARMRGFPLQELIARALIEEGACTQDNIVTCLPQNIFSGRYLWIRCSVIHAIALGFGVMFFGMLQKLHPTFRLPFIVGIISTSINVCFTVYFPYFAPLDVGLIVTKNILFTFATLMIVAVVIYPESSAFQYFNGCLGLLRRLKVASENNLRFFESMKPSDSNFSNYKNYHEQIVQIRQGIVPLEFQAVLSRYEISYGRLGPGAVGQARSCFKNLITASSTFEYFYQLIDSKKSVIKGRTIRDRNMSIASTDHHFKLFGTISEAYKPVGNYENNQRKLLIQRRLEQEASVIKASDIDYIGNLLKPFFAPYIKTNIKGMEVLIEWISAANSYRVYSIFNRKHHELMRLEMMEKLKEARRELGEKLVHLDNPKLLEETFQGKARDEEVMLSLISQCSQLRFFVTEQGHMITRMMDMFIAIDNHVCKPKIFTYFTKSIFDVSRNILLSLEYEVPRIDIPKFTTLSNVQQRDPDSAPPSNKLHVIGLKVVKLYDLFLDENLWFWFRLSVLVVACAIPYFAKETAAWYFKNRFVWIVIMCGVSTSEYTGETIYVFGAKLVYSFFGCLLGMVAWYISAGRGSGNYYGYGAVTAVVYLYLTYYRHFSIHLTLVPAILYGVSAALVLGSSWVDGNQFLVNNIGYGWRVAVTRFISVIVGLCVGFVASIIPRPKSSKVAIRVILSSVLNEIGNIYCDVSAFAFQRLDNPSIHIIGRHDPISDKFRLILAKLAGISKLMTPITHEVPMTGRWPRLKYRRLQDVITDIVGMFQTLHIIFDKLEDPDKWIEHILNRAGWYDLDLNADVFSIVHMCSGSLGLKVPLPKITQATLLIKHLDVLRSQWGVGKTSLNERFYQQEKHEDSDSIESESEKNELERISTQLHQSMVDNLDYDKLFGHDGTLSITALLLVHLIYERLDEVAIIIKSLVGESYDLTDRLLNKDVNFSSYNI